VGFIDDDALKKGKKIQGYPIMGAFSELGHIHEKYRLNGIVISFNGRHGHNKARYGAVRQFCRQHHLTLKQFQIN
jgi:UDP-GlcNAc:undecaprenyl-phosphate GlcNAc-1-phosphate transferase